MCIRIDQRMYQYYWCFRNSPPKFGIVLSLTGVKRLGRGNLFGSPEILRLFITDLFETVTLQMMLE